MLKNIADKYLPAEVIDRTKAYFPVPPLRFIEGEVLTLIQDTLRSKKCIERGLYNRETVDKMLKKPE